MNNNNTLVILRSLIVYAVCIPLAVWIGFMLADPFDRSTFTYFGIMALILCAPILLRWHHLLLVVSWNFLITIFFLPGFPTLWLPMVAISLGISVLHRSLNSNAHFISAPQIARPLIFLLVVIYFTAELTGGFGMKALGSNAVGGKRYVYLIVAILGYFALTAKRIPPKKAGLYVALFFIPAASTVIGDLATLIPFQSSFIFLLFPANVGGAVNGPGITELTRLGGLAGAGMALLIFMLARYGIKGIFDLGHPWRAPLFLVFFFCMLFGGYRTFTITFAFLVVFLFFFERIYRSRLMPMLILGGLVVVTLIVPFAGKLPFTFQRSLAFVPWLPISTEARMSADATADWRLQIWKAVLPQVPGYLLLGKGYYTSASDYEQNSEESLAGGASAADWSAAVSGNYHSGPLSVAIFFGIWGIIGVLWFFIAGMLALYDNYRYGDPALKTINALIFAYFASQVLVFLIVFGSFFSDMYKFTGLLGLSVSLNGGIRRPARARAPVVDGNSKIAFARPRFQPFYPR
jgi:hypothetical protein